MNTITPFIENKQYSVYNIMMGDGTINPDTVRVVWQPKYGSRPITLLVRRGFEHLFSRFKQLMFVRLAPTKRGIRPGDSTVILKEEYGGTCVTTLNYFNYMYSGETDKSLTEFMEENTIYVENLFNMEQRTIDLSSSTFRKRNEIFIKDDYFILRVNGGKHSVNCYIPLEYMELVKQYPWQYNLTTQRGEEKHVIYKRINGKKLNNIITDIYPPKTKFINKGLQLDSQTGEMFLDFRRSNIRTTINSNLNNDTLFPIGVFSSSGEILVANGNSRKYAFVTAVYYNKDKNVDLREKFNIYALGYENAVKRAIAQRKEWEQEYD